MSKKLQAGEGTMEGIIILAVILIIVISMPKNPSQTASVSPGSIFYTGNSPIPGTGSTGGPVIKSAPQAQYISLGTGNAAYSYQPYEEYVTIENYGREPVNITGWQLKNGKDKRAYYQGGMLQRFSADVAVVPQAARLLSPTGQNILGDVILAQGESAVVTTGSVNVQSPYKITSFKENSCTGYLEKLPDYAFTPPLSQNCPWPSKEPGIENLPPECRDIISTISSCQTPVLNHGTSTGNLATTVLTAKSSQVTAPLSSKSITATKAASKTMPAIPISPAGPGAFSSAVAGRCGPRTTKW